jgi:hypothetical protein
MDSGGYSTLSRFGKWDITPAQYVRKTAWCDRHIGNLEMAAPQDWMCEPPVIAKTGLTPGIHQIRTTINFSVLNELWPQHSDEESPYFPVLQAAPGDIDGYLRHIDMYEEAGINLWDYHTVGIGTVCRIQSNKIIGLLARELNQTGLRFHWFGVKTDGIPLVWPRDKHRKAFGSFDSMAWSATARYRPVLLPECKGNGHINCANCVIWARKWRQEYIMDTIGELRKGNGK